jgi:hypothetical protein
LKKHFLFSLVLLVAGFQVQAQRGGETIFGLLHLTQSARVASLGGNQVGLDGTDLAMLIHNPALLDSTLSRQISMSYVPYMAGITYGYSGIAWNFNRVGNFALGFQHVGYGDDFIGADDAGIKTGNFSAGETVIQLSYSRKVLPRWTAGASIKPVFSRIEAYSSWGLAFDAGFFYRNRDGLFTGGLVLRNFGTQMEVYNDGPKESMPPDLQVGIARKLPHAPFRFSLTAQDLLSGSLQYMLPDTDGSRVVFGDSKAEDNFAEKMLKHLVVGVEFVPSQNFYVAAGINSRRRQELKVDARTSTVGFTWGFGLRVNRFHFSYGSGRYHLSESSNHFSISTNLTSF